MTGRDLGTDAVLALGDNRIAEGHHVHALVQHTAGEFVSNLGIVQHHGHDGMLTGQQLEAQFFHTGAEVGGVLMYLVPQHGALFQQIDGLDGGSADGGSQGVGEQVGTAALAQQIHDERFIGANWWTPAHIVPLIEIVRADITSDDTAKRLYDFFESVGKKPILINREVKGFVGNRIQFAVMREAMNIVENGYASCEDVDRVLHYGLGLRYAVLVSFRTADFGGVDTFCHISDNLFSDLSTRTDANDMIRKLYEENKLGIKTGEGFYQYTPESIQEGLHSRDEQLLDILKITT